MAEKPIPLSQDELNTFSKLISVPSTMLGGVQKSTEKTLVENAGAKCAIVIYAADDGSHEIRSVEMCEVKPGHFELGQEKVTGHW